MFLIRIILFFLFLYLLIYVAGKIFSIWFRNKARKYQANSGANTSKKEGEVTIQNSGRSKGKKFNRGEGDYISFEEIEDK